MKQTISYREAAAVLTAHDGYLILTHIRPDGDTVGCAAGLCRALRQRGKTAWVLPNPELNDLFSPYLEGLLAPEGFQAETVVSVDIAARSLFPDNAKQYLERVDLAIDHHASQEFFARKTCVEADRASCGEVVYEIARELGPVTADIATPLYVAVSTDCGCFVYSNVTAAAHRVAAQLIDCGIPLAQLNKRHFRTKSWKRLKLESMLIAGMELYDGGEVAIAALTRAMEEELQTTSRDREDIAALPGQLEGVQASATLRELEGKCKLSLRTSGGYVDASRVCALFGGGGHAAAAGAMVEAPVEQARQMVLEAIRRVRREAGEG